MCKIRVGVLFLNLKIKAKTNPRSKNLPENIYIKMFLKRQECRSNQSVFSVTNRTLVSTESYNPIAAS